LRILFLTARFPWPLLQKNQLRAYHQLHLLTPRHHLTLTCFRDAAVPPTGLDAVSTLCERVVTVPLGGVAMAASLAGAPSPLPFQVSLYRHARMRRVLREIAAGKPSTSFTPSSCASFPASRLSPRPASWTSWTRCPWA
jgi:hypothetical protein